MEPVQLSAVLAGVIVVASMLSAELGISVALLELGLGVVAGNLFGLSPDSDRLVFIASFASIVLTFLAGAEVDPDDFRERFGATVTIGRRRSCRARSRSTPTVPSWSCGRTRVVHFRLRAGRRFRSMPRARRGRER